MSAHFSDSERLGAPGRPLAAGAVSIAAVERRLRDRPPRTISLAAAPRRAAVAVVLREQSVGAPTEVLYIRRVENRADPWSGQMAFPGGHIEPEDDGPVAAAVRETMEELALPLGRVGRLLGRLDDLTAMARGKVLPLAISPVVFALVTPHPLSPHPAEVADAVWLPLAALAAGQHDDTIQIERDARRYEFPCWRVGSHCVWGLTYLMTLDLLRRLETAL
jgi:8-oxo-dGTP pyrophosphatase MutT (NUDIX family)